MGIDPQAWRLRAAQQGISLRRGRAFAGDLLLAGKSVPQNLYDVAAGVLLVEEAGGRVSARDGSPFTSESTELIASNGLLHDEVVDMIAETTGGES